MKSLSLNKWKIRREFLRIKEQIAGWVSELYEPWLRMRHDRWRNSHMQPVQGMQPLLSRVAVYLIFQPQGLSASSLMTCRYLAECGFSVLVVSNCPLKSEDKQALVNQVWSFIERPNFGYDFGGYRDAWLWLEKRKITPETLVFLNDSIWFPALLDTPSDWLNSLCSSTKHFSGALELAGHRSDLGTKHEKKPFLGSFFLIFNSEVLRDAAFINFWRTYRMTSNKAKTIRRGERAVSAVLKHAGFTSHASLRREMIDEWIHQISNNATAIRAVLSDLETAEEYLILRKAQLLHAHVEGSHWLAAANTLIKEITNKQNLFVTASVLCAGQFKLPIIKKASTPENLKALSRLAKAHVDSIIKLEPCVYEEIQQRLKN